MGCGTRLVKILMFVANTIFAIAGLALLALAIYVRVEDKDYNSVFGKGGPFAPANIMIAAGVFVFLISFIGCLGAIKQSKCLLIMFIVFIVCVLLLETALIILAFVYREDAERYAKDAITEALQKTYGENGQSAITKAVDSIQKNFKCCGATNYTDWQGSAYIKKNPGLQVPSSCCTTGDSQCTNSTVGVSLIFKKDCVKELSDWAKNNLVIIGGLGAGVLVIELLAILFAAILINRSDSVSVA